MTTSSSDAAPTQEASASAPLITYASRAKVKGGLPMASPPATSSITPSTAVPPPVVMVTPPKAGTPQANNPPLPTSSAVATITVAASTPPAPQQAAPSTSPGLLAAARGVVANKDRLPTAKALQARADIGKHSPASAGGIPPYPLNKELSYFLKHGSFYTSSLSKSRRASIRKSARSFIWQDEHLYKCLSPEVYRKVPTLSMMPQVFAWCHEQGHVGQVATYNRVRKTYWWDGMKQDCYNYVKHCETCQKQHDPSVRTDRDMQPICVQGLLPFQKVAVDLAGPLPKTHTGFNHLLVVICYLTKWMEAIPIKNNKASTCAEVFVKDVIARFGCPLEVVSDNGHSFNGKFKICMAQWGIHNIRVAPYHPQSNGLVERCIQTIKRALSRMTGTKPHTWDKMLGWVLLAYRNSQQKSTGFSPHFLLFGREALLPEQVSLLTADLVIDETVGIQRYLDDLLTSAFDIQDTLDKVQDNVALSQDQQRRDFAIRRQSQTRRIASVQSLSAGSLLLAKRPHSQVTGLTQSWRGPYTLLRFLSAAKKSALLQEVSTGKQVRRAVAQLKPYRQPAQPPFSSTQALLATPGVISLTSSGPSNSITR
jgi:hypothetical protein